MQAKLLCISVLCHVPSTADAEGFSVVFYSAALPSENTFGEAKPLRQVE
jgi:hypothetical protein